MPALVVLAFIAAAIAWLAWHGGSGQAEDPVVGSTSTMSSDVFSGQAASSVPSSLGKMRTVRTRSITYDANAPLSSQLRALRRHADRGDRYATCILAFALDLCARGADRIITGDYANTMTEAIADEAVERMAMDMAFKERHALACAGLEEERYEDIDQRLLGSALAGHVPSMRKFALLPSRPGSSIDDPHSEFAQAHGRHAERMLNAAAEAGDPEAVRGVHYAYSLGYITSALGSLPVEKDAAKSFASLLAMARHAATEDRLAMERGIAQSVESMTPADLSRFTRLKAAYDRPGREQEAIWRGGENVMKDFPEVACADVAG
jgi:hypothetical protein